MPVELGYLAFLDVAALGLLAGIVVAIVFRYTSNRDQIDRSIDLIVAHLLEFRLFIDEPMLILRAQRDLLLANAALIRPLLLPSAILLLPCWLTIPYLDTYFGHAPLRVGQAAVLSTTGSNNLKLPPQILIETAGLHRGGEVSWRVRPISEVPIKDLRSENPSLRIPFPKATILSMPWWVWFAISSTGMALGARRLL